jgi:FkbM family methyltransferase
VLDGVRARLRLRSRLDRRGSRHLLAALESVQLSLHERRAHLVLPRQPYWLHQVSGRAVVTTTSDAGDPARHDREAEDFLFFDYEPRRGDTVIDVGAGAGEYLVPVCERVGPDGLVVCIEAEPTTFAALRLVQRLNRPCTDNSVLINAAATDRCGVVAMRLADDYLESSIAPAGRSVDQLVPGIRLDDIVGALRLERIEYLKMNIEGAEVGALEGATETLRLVEHAAIACHDFLASTHDDSLRTRGAVERLLRGAGFTLRSRDADPRPYIRDWVFGQKVRGTEEPTVGRGGPWSMQVS